MPNSTNGTAIYIRTDAGSVGPYLGAPETERLYFTIADASVENLYFGVQARIRNSYAGGNNPLLTNFYYRIFNAAGVPQTPATLFTNNGTAAGYIPNYASAVAGPNIGGATPAGYNPITFNPSANGDYYIELYSSNDGGVTAVNTAPGGINFLPYFDFTVSDASNNQVEGRIWSRKWSFITYRVEDADNNGTTPNVPNPSDVASFEGDFYAYTDDQVIVQVQFEPGFRPFGYQLAMNRFGIVNDDDDMTNDFLTTRRSQSYGLGTPVNLDNGYQVFITEPDQNVFIPSIEPNPVVADKILGCPGNYFIPITLILAQDTAIILDFNGVAGYQSGTEDVLIEVYENTPGQKLIPWDGNDGLGNPVTTNATTITVVSYIGRTNVPMIDAELNINGLSINGIAPTAGSKQMFWDDRAVTVTNDGTGCNVAGGSNALNNITTVNPAFSREGLLDGTFGPAHAWSSSNPDDSVPAISQGGNNTNAVLCDDFGNTRVINTWFYGSTRSTTPSSIEIPLCDNDNDGILDNADIDDDNDGVLDVTENNNEDPLADEDGDGAANYFDPDFSGFIDANGDGISDQYDLDGDGIINQFDLDTDGDGCSDAYESNATTDTSPNFQFTDLSGDADGLSPTVDPGNDGTPDYLVTYIQATDGVSLCVDQCNASASGNTNSDNDNISDFCDNDDDNDGIIDTLELNCSPNFVALGQTFSDNTSNPGVVNNIYNYGTASATFTYQIEGNTTWASGVSSQTVAGVDGAYINTQVSNTDFSVGDKGVYTLTFSEPIYNLNFKYGGLDNADRVDFQATNAGSNVPVTLTDINLGANGQIVNQTIFSTAGGNNAPNNSIQVSVQGPLDEIKIYVGKNNGNAGNVTLQIYELIYCLPLDTDSDTIPNHLDNDSDADGCFDAIEGDASITSSNVNTQGEILGNVDSNGVPDSVSGGQNIGSSLDDNINSCLGDLSGTVFEDTNGNGVQDAGEAGIAGVEVIITDVDGNPTTVTTDANGDWTATDIPVGDATVDVDETSLPADITDTLTTTGSDPETVTVVEGDLSGTVFEDTNGNGVQDAGEAGIAGVEVIITDVDGNPTTVTTDANGDWTATDIPVGDATVDVDETTLPADITDTLTTTGSDPETVT
ncbi:SdrD B-like domain-containing protein, partial [Mesoflavibacter zeaxanthinifaciens]|uniref:SdrD B-like domain-containing protein n=1 Tax=Mesoflavibacter zeaxanthinifaciens TaxID=393060 RepID=UPI003A910DA1